MKFLIPPKEVEYTCPRCWATLTFIEIRPTWQSFMRSLFGHDPLPLRPHPCHHWLNLEQAKNLLRQHPNPNIEERS